MANEASVRDEPEMQPAAELLPVVYAEDCADRAAAPGYHRAS